MPAHQQGDGQGEPEDKLERGPQHAHELNQAQPAADILPVGFFEGGDLGFFLGKGADQPGAGKVLLGLRGNFGVHGLNALEALMNLAPQGLHQDAGQGQRDQRDQGQPGADAEQEIQGADRKTGRCWRCT